MIILGTNSIKATGFDVANSVRFNRGSSDRLNRTPSSTGNRKNWTWSSWIKRSTLGSKNIIFGSFENTDFSNYINLFFTTANKIELQNVSSGSNTGAFTTDRVFRDPSAWFHLLLEVDTTESTASDRIKLYINGQRETNLSSTSNPSLNEDLQLNISGRSFEIGAFNSSEYFDGYMSEVVLLDSTSADNSSFGEFDSDSGIWKPIDVSGLTFGTNGFYLDFEDSSALGNDAAGSNNFTVNNLTAIDQSIDSCTNNFATLNPLNVPTSNAPTFSEGNLQSISSSSASGAFGGSSTIGVSSGKWYIETKCLTSGHNQSSVGVTYNDAETARVNSGGTLGYEYSYRMNGNKGHDNTDSSYGDTYTTNDIIGIALDLDNNKIYFSKNGTFQNSGNPESGSTGTGAAFTVDSGQTYMFYHQDNTGASSNTSSVSFNFGSPAYSESGGNSDADGYGNFKTAPPSGYFALNTKNLAEYG